MQKNIRTTIRYLKLKNPFPHAKATPKFSGKKNILTVSKIYFHKFIRQSSMTRVF